MPGPAEHQRPARRGASDRPRLMGTADGDTVKSRQRPEAGVGHQRPAAPVPVLGHGTLLAGGVHGLANRPGVAGRGGGGTQQFGIGITGDGCGAHAGPLAAVPVNDQRRGGGPRRRLHPADRPRVRSRQRRDAIEPAKPGGASGQPGGPPPAAIPAGKQRAEVRPGQGEPHRPAAGRPGHAHPEQVATIAGRYRRAGHRPPVRGFAAQNWTPTPPSWTWLAGGGVTENRMPKSLNVKSVV
jgi:hypothetical protein